MTSKSETKPVDKKSAAKKQNYYFAIGRRKTATARVRLYLKPGNLLVNDKPANVYFPGKTAPTLYLKPFQVIGQGTKFSFSAWIEGSGSHAQLEALIHGISRCLVKVDSNYKSPLKQARLLTRDPRMKESRKIGTGGKARRKKQSPKR